MRDAFVSLAPVTAAGRGSAFAGARCRRHRVTPRAASFAPTMMAKFQAQEENDRQLDEQTNLEKLIPPPALPTLTSLSRKDGVPDLPDLSTAPGVGEGEEKDIEKRLAQMGAGLTPQQETSIVTFLRGVRTEFDGVEWPSFSRVLKVTFIIIVSLVIAVAAIYVIDGFFYWVAQRLFETDV